MTTTMIERLPFTATGGHADELPVLRRFDPIESAGSLMLIDPTHPVSPWAAGVPANNTILPNIVEELALEAIDSATPAHVRPTLLKPAGFTGAAGLIERTAKGGLHGIAPQGGNAVAGTGPAIAFPLQMIDFLLDHAKGDGQGHHFYASLWFRPTRSPLAGYGNSTLLGLNGSGQQTNSALINVALNANPATAPGLRPTVGAAMQLGSVTAPNDSSLAPHFLALASSYWYTSNAGVPQNPATPISLPGDGTLTGVTGSYAGGTIPWGASIGVPGIGATGATTAMASIDTTSISANKDKPGSWILYRMYLEDLTLAGRSFAEVAALDQALYNKEVLTVGGRYYSDTFTNPSTLP